MSEPEQQQRYAEWSEANQRCLRAEWEWLRATLDETGEERRETLRAALDAAREALPAPSALDRLVRLLGLSPFERSLLLLCAGVELEAGFRAPACAKSAQAGVVAPTFGFALARLPEAHWSAVTPDAPLRGWRLLDVGANAPLTSAPLRLDERILHFLLGLPGLDERLVAHVDAVAAPDSLPPSHAEQVAVIRRLWETAGGAPPAVQLCGPDEAARRAVAARACEDHSRRLYAMSLAGLPGDPAEFSALQRLWEREALLAPVALLLEVGDGVEEDRHPLLRRWLRRARTPLLLGTREPLRELPGELRRIDLARPGAGEQAALWREALAPCGIELNGELDDLTAQFDLGASAIAAIARQSLDHCPSAEALRLPSLLWENCRRQARVKLDDLAERIEARATWDDLVLPERTLAPLRALATQARRRARVHEQWGFAAKCARGLGLSAMFHGPSGTGKTLAAEILAGEMGLDLYRIDLSQVVSKYIGETEKNLGRVFRAAEEGGAVLLFDEADALFGKRSEVRDSHDRYANIEVSYLLQRMENYRGLAVLTTNRKDALDPAFLRRLRFIIGFPFPDVGLRAEIWRRIYPAATPTEGLSPERLARLDATGGMIRNIALGAAFLAADEDAPVRMPHLRRAAQAEFAKLEKPLPAAETEAWS